MNSNVESESFGQIKKFEDLTEAEKKSGDWKPLPDGIRWQEMGPMEKLASQNKFSDVVQYPSLNRHERRKQAKLQRKAEKV